MNAYTLAKLLAAIPSDQADRFIGWVAASIRFNPKEPVEKTVESFLASIEVHVPITETDAEGNELKAQPR